MSDSVQPHRWQPTRLRRPWDSPGKNTGVSCHFLLQCTKVKSETEVAQSCPTLHYPMDCSLPGSSVHGIFQARVLEWVMSVPMLCNKYHQLSDLRQNLFIAYGSRFLVQKSRQGSTHFCAKGFTRFKSQWSAAYFHCWWL